MIDRFVVRGLRGCARLSAAVLFAVCVTAAHAQPASSPPPEKPAPRVTVTAISAGKGARPGPDDYVLVNYKGMLPDGTVFDQNKNAVMPLDQVVPGFAQGLVQMQRGGTYRMVIPSALAYGPQGAGPIPPNTDITFEISLIDFKTPSEIKAMMAQMQAAQAAGQAADSDGSDAGKASH